MSLIMQGQMRPDQLHGYFGNGKQLQSNPTNMYKN